MGLIKNSDTDDVIVYLTDLGRQRLLEQGFVPASFSLSDSGINYLANNVQDKEMIDLTGDYNDNVYSISENITIDKQIIR
jgi:hypothetical protein